MLFWLDSILDLRTNRILKMPDPCMWLALPITLDLVLIKYRIYYLYEEYTR